MPRLIIVLSILMLGVAANYTLSVPEATLNRAPLKDFPRVIGEWRVIDEGVLDRQTMAILQVDDYIVRTYANDRGQQIGLYIGYFTSQREGKGIHSPRQCLPGAGWTPIEAGEVQLPLEGHSPPSIPVDRYLMGKGDQRQLYLFWYQGRGRSYASEYWNKAYLIWDSITRNRTDGALVRLNISANSGSAKTMETLNGFIQGFFPVLSEHVPN